MLFLARTAAALAALKGWRADLACLLLGALATAALPPVGLVPLLLPAFVGLLWVLEGADTCWAAFRRGWCFGLGHHTAGLYWIANALLIDAARFWWMLPFAVLGLPAFLGILSGLVTLATRALTRPGVGRVLCFAAFWGIAEFVRAYLATGFPWNLLAYVWTGVGPMLQAAAWLGAYGLTLMTVLIAAAPAALVAPAAGGWVRDRHGILLTSVCVLVLAIGAAAGVSRLQAAPVGANQPGVVLRLVQPNLAQSLKWNPEQRLANFRRHLALTAEPAAAPLAAVIWPETATAFLFEREQAARTMATDALPGGALLITGTPRATVNAAGTLDYWNGMVALDRANEVRGTFDKFHLVPFGEYVPYRQWLPVDRIVPGSADFSAGPGPRTLRLPGLPPVSPLICYEVIFPHRVLDPADRPAWLLNLTNDGWYGYSAGPFQHFAIAAMRAVEEGMPLVRVANTGISGVVDPWGRVVARLGLEDGGAVDAPLPLPLDGLTLAARFGSLPFWLLASLLLATGGLLEHYRKYS